jgi:cytochrome P450
MPSAPTTSLDLTAASVVADPYPHFAAERAEHAVARHDAGGPWLTFTHQATSGVLRDRRFGRIWKDRSPADTQPSDYLEPFNLLHRNQMMENEPPEHTRLRRLVAGAFNRGHVERLRPRVRSLAGSLLAAVDPAGFDVVREYAEPLPVLVIAELLGVPASYAPSLREWSQAIVRMYEVAPSSAVVDAAVTAADSFAGLVRELAAERSAAPQDDLISDLVAARDGAARLTDDEVVASAVLLLNAGHEASVNVFGNGLVSMLTRGLVPGPDVAACVEEMLRFDSALQLFERTATADVELGSVTVAEGEKIAVLLGAANRDPAVFEGPDEFRVSRTPNLHLAFGSGLHFCLGAPLARMELVESVSALFATYPDLDLAAEPVSRGTFVLRGYQNVMVATRRNR